jgi:hypothetical protein
MFCPFGISIWRSHFSAAGPQEITRVLNFQLYPGTKIEGKERERESERNCNWVRTSLYFCCLSLAPCFTQMISQLSCQTVGSVPGRIKIKIDEDDGMLEFNWFLSSFLGQYGMTGCYISVGGGGCLITKYTKGWVTEHDTSLLFS